ncbi:unnamed protein product [Prunus armeniaca]
MPSPLLELQSYREYNIQLKAVIGHRKPDMETFNGGVVSGVVPPLCSRKPLYPGVWFVPHIASQVVF